MWTVIRACSVFDLCALCVFCSDLIFSFMRSEISLEPGAANIDDDFISSVRVTDEPEPWDRWRLNKPLERLDLGTRPAREVLLDPGGVDLGDMVRGVAGTVAGVLFPLLPLLRGGREDDPEGGPEDGPEGSPEGSPEDGPEKDPCTVLGRPRPGSAS